jgi:hypothetical protein
MLKLTLLALLALALASCSKFRSMKYEASDPAAFFKTRKVFCTVEQSGHRKNSIDRYEVVYVFNADNTLQELGSDSQLQFNSKGQPKLNDVARATFRVSGDKLMIKLEGADREQESAFKRVNRSADGKNADCFELTADSTTHCPCALPENE